MKILKTILCAMLIFFAFNVNVFAESACLITGDNFSITRLESGMYSIDFGVDAQLYDVANDEITVEVAVLAQSGGFPDIYQATMNSGTYDIFNFQLGILPPGAYQVIIGFTDIDENCTLGNDLARIPIKVLEGMECVPTQTNTTAQITIGECADNGTADVALAINSDCQLEGYQAVVYQMFSGTSMLPIDTLDLSDISLDTVLTYPSYSEVGGFVYYMTRITPIDEYVTSIAFAWASTSACQPPVEEVLEGIDGGLSSDVSLSDLGCNGPTRNVRIELFDRTPSSQVRVRIREQGSASYYADGYLSADDSGHADAVYFFPHNISNTSYDVFVEDSQGPLIQEVLAFTEPCYDPNAPCSASSIGVSIETISCSGNAKKIRVRLNGPASDCVSESIGFSLTSGSVYPISFLSFDGVEFDSSGLWEREFDIDLDIEGGRTFRLSINNVIADVHSINIPGCPDGNGNKVAEEDSGIDIDVYPNPASDFLVVSADDNEILEDASIEVLTMQGAKIGINANSSNQLDVGQLSSGIYLVKVELHDGRSTVRRIVVE